MSSETRRAVFVFAVLALLYFHGLTKTGMLGPDEPRYAAIGREMATSGDWVTPRLWGSPWFEKSPLLYWTTALATKAGLGPELGPRLPVAMLGFGFLIFFYWFVREEFGATEALCAMAILGSSGGWITYSIIAVTDIPLSATFCAALFLALMLSRGERKHAGWIAAIAGALLGLAVLAKGLVPLALFAPVVWLLRARFRLLLVIGAACLLVAAPWYILVTIRNGNAFIDEFIWKHHFRRFVSDELQHVRSAWFYIPVLLLGIVPWTPLVALVRPRLGVDSRLKFVGLWTLYALALFSASRNKLPGYILPLVPAVALLTGVGLAWARRTRIPLVIAALLIGLVPIAAGIIPQALVVGLSRSRLPSFEWLWLLAGLIAAAGVFILERQDRRSDAVVLVAVGLGIVLFQVKLTLMPALDRTVSVRGFYKKHEVWLEGACLQDVSRDERYGLQYYAGRAFPVCENPKATPKVMGVGNQLILLD